MEYSVLMSVYKNDNPVWVEEAINSILNQTIKTDDFIIIEDGPLTKELTKILKKYKTKFSEIKIITLKTNVGLGLALNRGVKECKHPLIARMDADDISAPNRIEEQLKIFKKSKNISVVGTLAIEFVDNINQIKGYATFPETNAEIIKYAKKRNPLCHPSIMYKKKSVIDAGNYQYCHLCEDYDLWIRMIQKNNQFYNIQKPLHFWRISEDFYKRRSGIKYLKSILLFLKKHHKSNFFSKKEYYSAVIIRSIVYMMPNFLRTFVYKNFLRKKNDNE